MTQKRRKKVSKRSASLFSQSAWQPPQILTTPIEILTPDQIEDIHNRTLSFLQTDGIEVLSNSVQSLLKSLGAEVNSTTNMVKFDSALLIDLISKAPSSFKLHARNPQRSVNIGGNSNVFMTVASAPNASDLAGGRRPGNYEDFKNLTRLSQSLNVVHAFGGYPVEPTDLPANTRHLDCINDLITLSDKAYRLYAIGAQRIRDGLEMTRIAHGLQDSDLDNNVVAFTNININSPLRIDGAMLDGLVAASERNQAVIITPFTLSGAMAPITLAGALLQQNIEALAGIAITQAVRPGSPVVYGCFTSNVDMKSGAPAFGTPEYVRAAYAGGQLARRYKIPYRSSNANASNAVDAQASYESSFSLQGAIMGGANIIQHAVGWLEGGLTASFEKMILDAELLQSFVESQKPIDTSEAEFGIDAMRQVGPGGHFFGTEHTLERFETAFYNPILSDWRNFGAWQDAGAPDALQRASAISNEILSQYQPPPLDDSIAEALNAFIARRKEEGGVLDA